MLGVLFLLVAAFSAYGIYAMLRSNRRSQQYLESSREEAPLQLDHLSRPLRRLLEDTRLLRISLEGPIRDVVAIRTGEFHQTAGADTESFDNMLMDVTRQVVEWVETAERLGAAERSHLESLGVTPQGIRHVLDAEGGAFERRHLRRPGAPPLDQRLQGLSDELSRIELALQANGRVYR